MPSLPLLRTGPRCVLFLALSTALAGCASPPGKSTLAEIRTTSNPVDRAQRSITNFTPALRCMDEMMFTMGTRDVTMMMEEFRDATQRVPVSARDMLTSAISDMSRRSRGIRLTVFGSDQQNLTQFLQLAQRANTFAVVPEYSIRGTISQLDESVKKSSVSVGTSLAESLFGVRFGSDIKFSVLGFDAAVVQTSSMTLLPGVSSKNTTVLSSNDASAGDGVAKLVNPGIGLVFSFAASRADGTAQATRNMIELATVELVGKLIRAPYWQCLGTPDTDPEIQREMDDWFFSMDEGERISFFKERMRERRYFDGAIDGESNANFNAAMETYRKAMKIPVQGPLDATLFKQFVTLPVPRGPLAAGFKKAALNPGNVPTLVAPPAATPTTAATPIASAAPTTAVAALATAPPLTLSVLSDKASPRKSVNLSIEVSRAGYVYCYSQDTSTGKIQRVFPNRFTRDPRLVPGKPFSVPGRAAFVLNPASEYACMHAPSEVYGDLPPPLRWGDFEDVRLPGFDEIRAQFSQAAGQQVFLVRPPTASKP